MVDPRSEYGQFIIGCISEFLNVALSPDPVRHGCDLSDIIAARKFVAALDDLHRAC